MVNEDEWGESECLYKACQEAITDGCLFTDTGSLGALKLMLVLHGMMRDSFGEELTYTINFHKFIEGIYVMSYLIPVTGHHLWLHIHLDVWQSRD